LSALTRYVERMSSDQQREELKHIAIAAEQFSMRFLRDLSYGTNVFKHN